MSNHIHPGNDFKQVDGSAITATSTNVNSGVGLGVGTTSTVLANRALGASEHDIYCSKVVNVSHTHKPLTAGTFAYRIGHVIRRVTASLSGVANTTLRSGAANFGQRRAIHQAVSVRTYRIATAIRAGYWTDFSASWSTDPTAANDFSAMTTTQTGDGGSTNQDDAANPTYAKPGELVYKHAAPEATQADYSAKTG